MEYLDVSWLNHVRPWVIFVSLAVLLTAATESGFRIGRRARPAAHGGWGSEVTTVQAAVLGLLALLLGFTFSMAVTRYDLRKQLVLEEANSIGTTYLRTRLLPPPHSAEAGNLLRQYVDARLAFYEAGMHPQRLREASRKTERLQAKLWSHAVAAGKIDRRAVTTGLFISSLNDLIDNHARRLAALENQVPASVFVLLYVAAIAAMALTGYGLGVGGQRNPLCTVTATILIASVVFLIADLDRPRRGLIRVSQQSMVRLQQSLQREAP
jgi:hypothetical protein